MKRFLLVQLVRLFLLLNDRRLTSEYICTLVCEADAVYDNSFSKRGYVYQALKDYLSPTVPTHTLNLIVELGVYLHHRQ